MRDLAEAEGPRVFLSYAGSDQAVALRLGQDLARAGIDTFVAERSIAPGGNWVLAIEHALSQSDYYVLLWSHAAVDRPWVTAEWSAALARELDERRLFLFVVRLDQSPVPRLLAARRYLDAFDHNWNSAVEELIATWRRDWAAGREGIHVFPAPRPPAAGDAGQHPMIVLYVRNSALKVEHVLAVPEQSTGEELRRCVRHALALPDIVERFEGRVGMRFSYQLRYGPDLLPPTATLPSLGITDGAVLGLEVHVAPFGPTGPSATVTYRGAPPPGLPAATGRHLINAAFGHLTP